MDINNGSDSTSQRYMQGSSSSTFANATAPETTVSSNIRPVLNYSIQTGEEFALEFMRERVIPKKPSVPSTSGDQNTATSYMELRGVLGISHTGSETGSDVSMLPTVDKGHFKETGNRSKYASSRSGPRISLGDGSSRGASHGYYSSGASDVVPKKMKFLCSFGGKILPRPSDGKLRYVGGDTRIIRIIKDITWQELTQKTMKIYNQPHNLKYQLPGEDLDALISVSCEEDLQNMMEECSVLESGEGSQKLRMFLFPSGDFDDMNLNLESIDGDSEIQYVVAVNGMDLGSRRTSGHGIANTSGNELDQLLNLHVEVDGANSSRVATESNEIHTGPLAGNMVGPTTSPLLTHLSSDYYPHLDSYQDYQIQLPEGEYYPYSAIQHPGSAHNLDGRISIPSSVPSDYNYTSQYAPVEGTAVLPQQELFSLHHGLTEGLYVGTQTRDPEVQMEETLTVDSLAHQKDEEECSRVLENEVTAPRQQLTGLGPNHMQAEVLSHKGNLELALGTLPVNAAYPGESGGLNEDDHYTSGGAFISGFSDYEADVTDVSYNDPPSHSSRLFRSERIPKTQAEIFNRLSKSDDSIGSQYLILQSRSGMGPESIAEAIDHSYEGSIVSQAENASISAKSPVLNPATLEDGLMQFEKYKELANTITQMNQLEETSIKPESETTKAPRPPARGNEPLTGGSKRNPEDAVVNPMSCATYDQTDVITDGQSNKSGRKIQKSELIHPTMIPVADEDTVKEEEFYHESNMSSHTEKSVNVGETGIDKSNVIKSPVDGSDITNNASGSAGIGAATVVHENPYSNLPEINWADITCEDSSLPTKGRKDILVDINDRFPHNLISDLFSRARLTEDSQNVTLPRDDTGLSLNTQNLEPQRWSFFRNLAQDDFTRKDVSLMDQDHIDYSTLLKKVEEGIPNPYEVTRLESEGVDLSRMDSRIEFEEEIQKESSGTNEDTALNPDYILPHANLLDQSGQRLQVENPYSRVGEKLITHVMETEDLKFGIGEVGGSVLDASVVDYDFSHLQIIKNDDLEELKELGSGTFGTVYHGKWRGTDVAIKRIKKSCFTGRSSEQERLTSEFWREAGILSSLHHPNVVAFYGVVQDGPGATLATVAEFMVNGSLRHVLQRKDRAERYLDRRKRLIIAMDAAFGMEYLHSKNIVHFDLKCDNLLVNLKDQTRPICKVGDFGLSKIKQNTLVSGGVRGTLPWMAPELLNGSSNKVSEKVDVFSFGIVMWEILTGEEPYANMHYGAIIGGIVNNTLRPPVPASCDPEWRRLMEQCWAPDPAQRPSFTQIASRLRAMSVASQTKAGK